MVLHITYDSHYNIYCNWFLKKNNKLGWTGIALLLSVLLLIGTMAFRTGKPQHYVLLVALIVIELGFIIYFLTTLRRKVSSSMYLDFYNPSSYSKGTPIPLSYYGLGGDKDTLLKLMKGTEYAFALKEDMPIDLGAEGTYSFWLRVCPVNFNKENKNWRTVWYRGNPDTGSIYQQKTPGVYLAPNTNKMIITVACENGPDEGNAITLDDIPLNTWFCTTIVLNGRSLDVYVNGLLERSISLTGMPLMTNSNLLKGRNGFDGLMAFFRYSSAAEEPHHIRNMYERERITLEGSEYPLNCE